MTLLETISLGLDILLVAAAAITYVARPRIGGELSRGLRILLGGVIVLGLAHLIETAMFTVFNLSLETNEILHRLIVMFGFVFVILGFLIMRRAFED